MLFDYPYNDMGLIKYRLHAMFINQVNTYFEVPKGVIMDYETVELFEADEVLELFGVDDLDQEYDDDDDSDLNPDDDVNE